MANTTYVKTIQLGLDMSKIKEETKSFGNNISKIWNDVTSSFQERMFGGISSSRQLKNLEKDLSRLKRVNSEIIQQRKEIENSDVYRKYESSLLEREKLSNVVSELSGRDTLTDEEKTKLQEAKDKLKDFSKQDELYQKFKTWGASQETEQFNELFTYLQRLEELEKEQTNVNNEVLSTKGEYGRIKAQDATKWQSSMSNLAKGITNKFVDFLKGIGEKISDLFKDALNEYKEMASYNLETSKKINTTARENALMYGMSSSQSYAFERAKKSVGANSMEDLYLMTPAQRERFAERIGYFNSKYQELADKEIFEKYEEYQATVEDLKTDLQMKVISFFAENKDTIVWALETGVTILQGVMDTLTSFFNWISGSTKEVTSTGAISDVVNNYSNRSSSNTNVKIDNNFTGFKTEDVQKLREAGNTVNRQLIDTLNQS